MAERSSKAEKERAFKAVQDIIDQYARHTTPLSLLMLINTFVQICSAHQEFGTSGMLLKVGLWGNTDV